LSDYSINGQSLEILSAYSADEDAELMRATYDISAVLPKSHGKPMRRPRSRRIFRTDLRQRDVRNHLRNGTARTATERRVIGPVRHQRLQGEDELHRRQGLHLAHGGLAQLSQPRAWSRPGAGMELSSMPPRTLYDFKSMQRIAEGVLTQIGSLIKSMRRHPRAARRRRRQ